MDMEQMWIKGVVILACVPFIQTLTMPFLAELDNRGQVPVLFCDVEHIGW